MTLFIAIILLQVFFHTRKDFLHFYVFFVKFQNGMNRLNGFNIYK